MIAAWVKLCARREHPMSLAVFRILIATVLLADLLVIWQLDLVEVLFAPREAGGLSDVVTRSREPWVYKLFGATAATASGLYWVMCCSCLAVLFGFWTRGSCLVLLLASSQMALISPAADRGIDMLIRNSADELGIANIRVNSVCPGLVDTELATGLMTTEEVHNDYLNCMPIKRTGEVGDIAGAVRFLCGPDSSWITGVNLSVDGGHHLRRGPNVEPFSRMLFGDDLTEGRF